MCATTDYIRKAFPYDCALSAAKWRRPTAGGHMSSESEAEGNVVKKFVWSADVDKDWPQFAKYS